MTNLMYDAAYPANIPADATEVAGYIDGAYKWSASDWARFTLATVKWRITAIPFDFAADVCDCENGDYTPGQAAQWAVQVKAQGRLPIIYCSLSLQPQIVEQLVARGLQETDVEWWIADYDNQATLVPNIPNEVAKQYEDAGPFDLSVTDLPSTIPPVTGDDELMVVFDTPGQNTLWWTGTKLVTLNAAGLGYVRDQLGVPYKELDANAYAFAVFSLTPTAPAPEHLTVSSTVTEAPA